MCSVVDDLSSCDSYGLHRARAFFESLISLRTVSSSWRAANISLMRLQPVKQLTMMK